MIEIVERLRYEADISDRPGQMDRLNAIADELAADLAKARELRALVTEFANELEQRLAAIASQPADCGNCHEGTTEFGHRCPQCEGGCKQPAERESGKEGRE